jgi:glutamine amidotransferase
LKLPNPNANCFEYQELKDAMLKTVAQLNEWAEEYNITEVYCTVNALHNH